jgi:uncharacterized glyoxalase superfamily protein PhnB
MNSTIIPGLLYNDASRMIDWLCDTFGFRKNLVVPNGEGGIAHAQLVLNGGMIMLGSAGKNEMNAHQRPPADVEYATSNNYIVVSDADSIYAKAKANGAKIILDIVDQDYGGRGFTCADPEGHLWSVGTYDPWAEV